jgi:2-polyprenyl-6-hydroxyphenyl methylase/3-demethylubiquinone-9 3-methyltransferase
MQFDFGQNWKEFSENSLTAEKVDQAREHFRLLMKDCPLKDRRFVDIGFGQGLSLLLALQEGAQITGVDINPKCAEVLERNKQFLGIDAPVEVLVGSILEDSTLQRLGNRQFDIVHSWGVLHHTGDMYAAIDRTCSLVAPNGRLVLAIYNRHWSSLPWKWIKWLYCVSPAMVQKLMIALFFPVIFSAKLLVTRENPLKMTRGMDFYYNIVDWVGGYPYEYASREEMIEFLDSRGFVLETFVPARVPTGCNEFVFRKAEA